MACLQLLYTFFIAGLRLFKLLQLAMTVSLRSTDCTQLTAQGDCISLPFNLLQQLCLAQAKPVMQASSVLMLLSFCVAVLQWLSVADAMQAMM